ncbi:MAG: hypothetical protein IKT34_01060, partial [Clostridia bacterium]|nr:hypothetical protein [Clostridia bacterium]
MELLFKRGKARHFILVFFDILCFIGINSIYFLSTMVLENTPAYPIEEYFYNSLIMLVCMFVARVAFKVYSNVWRYTSTSAYFKLLLADTCGGAVALLTSYYFVHTYWGFWHFMTVASLTALLAMMSRLTYRMIYKRYHNTLDEDGPSINVAIVGAGQLGVLLASDLTNNRKSIYRPVFFIDKDKTKAGSRVYDLPVYFENTSALERVKHEGVSEIFIAIANLTSEEATRLYDFYSLTGCKIKIYDIPV